MKLGVTTLGCPDWTLDEILSRLPQYGYEGVELRGLGPDLDLTKSPAFDSPVALARTRQSFSNAGLAICGIDTSCSFAGTDPAATANNLDEGRRSIDLANALDAPTIRVFGGSIVNITKRPEAAKRVAEALLTLGEYAAQTAGVSVVLETHDAFSTGTQAAEALRQAVHPRVGVLWDLHHPYRQGEAPEETFAALRPYVKQTHVKDSQPGGTYCLLGEGDIPILQMLRLLKGGGYDGWINLEWEKRWIPALAEPEIAFPQYAARLREYLAEL
jgi:sugar phosphate isomerase/epimerase